MKFIRTRCYQNDAKGLNANGKFSIWAVILTTNEIKTQAKRNPARMTYRPIELFRVLSNGANDKHAIISHLGGFEALSDLDTVKKTIELDARYEIDEDDNATVFFYADQNVIFYSPENTPTTEYKEFFSFDFLGYVPGSFYHVFDAIFKGGNFATVDGSKYLTGEEKIPAALPEQIAALKKFKEDMKVAREAAYKVRNAAREEAADVKKATRGTTEISDSASDDAEE